jgi:predicted  nucleic acid-binding Zn-ribbon protein
VTTAPAADQRRLLDLQALDTRLDQIAHKRANLPTLTRLTELGTQAKDLKTALVTSQTARGDLRRELAKAEGDVEQVSTRAARDQARLDAGGSVKDLQALTSELVALAHRQADLEEVELDVMERLEAHEAALAKIQVAYDALEEARAAAGAERDAAFDELDAEAARVRAERDALAAAVEPTLLALYEKLRARLHGLAVARLRHGRSEASGLTIPAHELARIKALPPEEIVFCEDSGRILVRSEDSWQ